MKPYDILNYLEDYKKTLLEPNAVPTELKDKSILISIKIPQNMLKQFKSTCEDTNTKYQTQIKILMKQWLDKT